jgi:hypothetical protein
MSKPLDSLDVFYGDLTVAQGYIYARLPRPTDDVGLSLAGTVRGPRCLHSQTLPLSSPLVDLGPGPTLLARAVVPDPCFWSPDVPAIYDVTVNLLKGREVVATERREIGLRSFGVRGRGLVLEGNPWVLRGVIASSTTDHLPRAWHEALAAYVTVNPEDECLADAAQWGSLTVVELTADAGSLVSRLRGLARFPGVAVAVVRGAPPAAVQPADIGPNLILAQFLGPGDPPVRASWAQVVLAAAADPRRVAEVAGALDVPLVAVRPLDEPLPIAAARAACDALQRDLAPYGQFAGYIV